MTDPNSVGDAFHAHFQVVPAYSKALRDAAYRIRYQVYCEELGFEDKRNFPDGRERDDFDRHSEHCLLLHRETNTFVGCVRLVLPDAHNLRRPLPFETACGRGLHSNIADVVRNGRGTFGEISRLALIRTPQSGCGEFSVSNIVFPARGIPDSVSCAAHAARPGQPKPRRYEKGLSRDPSFSGLRGFSHVGLGLYLAGAAMALNKELRSVFAMMEPRLARRLRHYGIHFRQVGDVVDYHGLRGPFQITRDGLFTKLCPRMHDLLEVLVEDLQRSNPFETAVS